MLLKRMQSALARLTNESLHRRENRFAAYRTGGSTSCNTSTPTPSRSTKNFADARLRITLN